MAEVLGLGITHYPMLAAKDPFMANLMKMVLKDPDIPAERKDPANWSALAQEEWSDDQGTAAAGRHRKALLSGLSTCREALDEFKPDVVIVWATTSTRIFARKSFPRSASWPTPTQRSTRSASSR